MVMARGGEIRVPLRCWPLEIALEELAAGAPLGSSISLALSLWPVRKTSAGLVRPGVDAVLMGLAKAGFLFADGCGADAGLRLAGAASIYFQGVTAKLSIREQYALHRAAQVLVACLTTWSKNSVAAGPISASTS